MYKRYNTDNLKPFTRDNASYYGKRGGLASGKSKMEHKLKKLYIQRYFIIQDLEQYKKRKTLYNRDIENIKNLLHHFKIYTNRINKLESRYSSKYKNICS